MGVQTTLPLEPRVSKESQAAKILRMLKRGEVTNYQLNKVCFRFSARLHDLRKDGHNITSTHVKGSKWVFRLVNEA